MVALPLACDDVQDKRHNKQRSVCVAFVRSRREQLKRLPLPKRRAVLLVRLGGTRIGKARASTGQTRSVDGPALASLARNASLEEYQVRSEDGVFLFGLAHPRHTRLLAGLIRGVRGKQDSREGREQTDKEEEEGGGNVSGVSVRC